MNITCFIKYAVAAGVIAATAIANAASAVSMPKDAAYWAVVDRDPAHRIDVGPNVLVSKDDADAMHAELYVGADPTNANRLVACGFATTPEASMFSQNGQWDVVYASRDGGASWKLTRRSNAVGSDPGCVFDRAGRAYFLESGMGSLVYYHSDDGGFHWLAPSTSPSADNVYLVPDRFVAGKHGRLYVVGQLGPYFYSDDGGLTFKTIHPKADIAEQFSAGQGAVLSDGTLLWPRVRSRIPKKAGYWPDPLPGKPSGWVRDWVVSPSNPNAISKVTVSSVYHPMTMFGSYAINAPIATDTTTKLFHNRIYTVFTDSRSGRGRILFTSSNDRGKTWSLPVLVDDDRTSYTPSGAATGPEDFMPMLAVNTAGVVGVAWYDRRDNPDRLGWYVRFTASLDGGATWLPSVRVSSAPESYVRGIDPRDISQLSQTSFGASKDRLLHGGIDVSFHLDAFRGGDYSGMAAGADGRFHPVWVDNRTGVPNIWSASIGVSGDVRARPYSAVSSLKSDPQARRMQTSVQLYGSYALKCTDSKRHPVFVKNQVLSPIDLLLSGLRYDPQTRIISAWARAENLSKTTLRGPFDLVLNSIESERGTIAVVNAENRKTGVGASWRLLQDASPHDYTDAAFLQFRLVDPRPFAFVSGGCTPTGHHNLPSQLLSFTARLMRVK